MLTRASAKPHPVRLALRLVAASLLFSPFAGASAAASAPNFLFVAVDDLNDFSGYASEEEGNFLQEIYPNAAIRAKVVERLTPTLNRLAEESAPFTRAYCPSALCGPSRTSLMTGVAPHVSGYYMHNRHFRLYETLEDIITLPQQLKTHGYFTAGAGKIFHKPLGDRDGELSDDWADVRHSWNTWVNHGQGAAGKPDRYAPPKGGNMQWGRGNQSLEESGDWNTADFIARVLENGGAKAKQLRGKVGPDRIDLPKDQPFFLACGLFRPHLPFYAPQEYFDMFPVSEMTGLNRRSLDAMLADLDDLPEGANQFIQTRGGKMHAIMEHANELGGQAEEVPAWKSMVQSYLACVAFADACLGRLFEGLENSEYKDNTVVFLWSDHGYHVGAKYRVAKQAVWEKANRVVLMVRDPRNAGSNGIPRRQLASLNDMYPTICDLAGIPLPGPNIGRSLVPLLNSADAAPIRDDLVFTYMQGNHCLRSEQYAYLRYRDGTTELYDMIADPNQQVNLASHPEQADQLRRLDARLEKWLASPESD